METIETRVSFIGKGEWSMGSVNTQDRHGHTPLMDAAKEGDQEGVRDLLHRGADITVRSIKGKTALHYAAANGHADIVRDLLERGAEVDARDREGRTPLMLAAIYGCNHTVQSLAMGGADLQAKTLSGNTAMVYAQNNNHPLTLAILQKAHRVKQPSA